MHCWGNNDKGQLGDGTTTHRLSPNLVSGITPVGIGIGSNTSCSIDAANAIYCFGDGDAGNIGGGNNQSSNTSPVKVLIAQ